MGILLGILDFDMSLIERSFCGTLARRVTLGSWPISKHHQMPMC